MAKKGRRDGSREGGHISPLLPELCREWLFFYFSNGGDVVAVVLRSVPLSLDGVNYTERAADGLHNSRRDSGVTCGRHAVASQRTFFCLLTNARNDVAVAEAPRARIPSGSSWLGTLKRLRDSLLDAL